MRTLMTVAVGAVLFIAPMAAQRRAAPSVPSGAAGRGARGPSPTDRRIEQRSYRFPDTNEKIEYDVFVSKKVNRKAKSPLVIALHGLGVTPAVMLSFVMDAAEPGGYIVAAPTGYSLDGWYGAHGPTPPGATPPNLGELSERDVMNVLDLMRHEFLIDDQRIYLLGQSMGGAGALYLGVKHHEIWAAVAATAPAAGALRPSILAGAAELPMMVVQGDADEAVSPARTREWVAEMRDLKMTYEYYEIPGAVHRDAIVIGAPRVFAFFGKHVKPAPAAP